MSALIFTDTIIQDMIPSSSSWFTAIHLNMVYYPRTFMPNMRVPNDGKKGFEKNDTKPKLAF